MSKDRDYVEQFIATIKKEKDILLEGRPLTKNSAVEIYAQAIYMGYLDASRTFKNRKVTKKDSEVKEISEDMKKYIFGYNDDFDSFFEKACDELCRKYKMEFGQAQKIINMAFKYLYCIVDDEFKPRFNKCHMPLDGIMLEWIHRNIKDDDGNNLKKKDTWSKIEKGAENEACTYKYYKKYIDKYCMDNNKTPLQLDFENWIDMSQTLAAETYLKNFSEDELKNNEHIKLINKVVERDLESHENMG